MDKFEYTIRTVDRVNKPLAMQELLTHCKWAGEEGWELVQIVENNYNSEVQNWDAILKRKINENTQASS